jgi:peptidoglycan/LPS O-acetylase OafA/YrhL
VSEYPAFRTRAVPIFVAVVLSFAVIYQLFNAAGGFAGLFASPLWIVLPTIEGAFFACAIAGYEAIPGFTIPWLSAAVARVGEVSYSIYLTHYFFMMWLLRRIGRYIPANVDFPTISIIAVALFPLFVGYAILTYSLIEKPFLRFRRPYAKAADAAQLPRSPPADPACQDERSRPSCWGVRNL